MIEGPICYFAVEGGFEDKLSQTAMTDYTKEDIATLRGLYEMDKKVPLIPEGKDERTLSGDEMLIAAKKLIDYKNSQAKRHLDEMKNSSNHVAKVFAQLYKVDGWNEATRRNRINMIVAEFTTEVSNRLSHAKANGQSLTREQIVNGYKDKGKYYEGQFSIFEAIFNRLIKKFNDSRELVAGTEGMSQEELKEVFNEEDLKQIELAKREVVELPKIFNNWSALCVFARMSLRDTESLKLGNTLEYAAPTTPDNFTIDSPLEDIFDLEESVREAWMTHQSETSAFGSLGSEVRRFLATITNVDAQGDPIMDDLNYPQKMDPVETHQYLADILRGITTENSLIRKLHSLSVTDSTTNAIFKALAKASIATFTDEDGNLIPIDDNNRPKYPVIITQLLEDMHKNMVPYTALIRNKAGKIVSMVLNRQDNPLRGEFDLRMSLGTVLSPSSIYRPDGKVNWENLAKWRSISKIILPQPMGNDAAKESDNVFAGQQKYDGSKYGFYTVLKTDAERIQYIKDASLALGVAMTDTTARRIYNDKNGLRSSYLKALREFRVQTNLAIQGDIAKSLEVLEKYQGVRPSLSNGHTVEDISAYDKAVEELESADNGHQMDYTHFLRMTYGSSKSKKGEGYDRIGDLLSAVAKVSNNLKTERRISWFDRHNKANSRYSDRTPSYMGDLVDKLHEFVAEGDATGLKNFIMDKWGKSSFFYKDGRFLNSWIQELYDSIKTDAYGNITIDKEAFAKVFQFDEFLGSNIDGKVSIFENFTEKQHAEAMLKQFLEIRDLKNGATTLAKYPCFILGDSGAQMFFTARRYNLINGKEDAKIINGLKDVFRQEIERRKYVNATNKVLIDGGFKTIDNFSQTADEFTMLTFLNPTFEDGKYWKILTGEDKVPINADGKIDSKKAMDLAVSALDTDALEDALTQYMNNATEKFKKKLVSVGILTESKGEGGAITYTDTHNFFNGQLGYYKNDIDAFIKDFFWNTKYATIEQLQMFTVDPAFYDHRYPVKDLQKRYKEIYAPGKGISLEARDYDGKLYMTRSYERAVYFDDIKLSSEDINPEFFKVLNKTFGEDSPVVDLYRENTLTDGQGYRTLDSYRAVKGMAGEWTLQMETAYKRIKAIRDSGRKLTEDDIKEIANLAVLFQPIKPYMYTLEKLEINHETHDTALIPVQHKYAEVVLIPELLADGKLKDMALWMENHINEKGEAEPIDMVASTKCVKVGAFGSVAIKGIHNDASAAQEVALAQKALDGNTDDSKIEALTKALDDAKFKEKALDFTLDKAFVHNLPWADYRIQSGVPEHLNHAQLFGTQIRKLILAGISKDPEHYYQYLGKALGIKPTDSKRGVPVYLPGMGKVYLNGSNLISFYNCLVMGNMMDSYDTFQNQTTTNKALSDKLLQNVISNSNQSEDNAFGFSLIDDGDFAGEFTVPLGEPGLEHDASALLFSLFKKIVNKQKIKGGSAVQASAMGLSGKADAGDLFEVVSPEGDNILYDEVEMPWNVSYTSATGKNVPLRFEDWCNTDGTLKHDLGVIVHGEDAREYLSWPVSGRDEFGRAKGSREDFENGYHKDGYYVPDIEVKYPGILDIIAYRIPTEMEYSMVNCKVFRYSNPLAGGTLKVPSSRTTTAGFDFDIDKLYFFMREFAQTHLSDKQIEDIWKAIYNQHPEWKKALEEARDRDSLGKDFLNALATSTNDSGLRDSNGKVKERRLHTYWESAGLEGTDSEAFTKYLEDHRDEYPVFDVYNPEVSPLNSVKDKDGNIVTAGNTRVARNNMLLDLMRARLMDKETLKQRYTPGGFSNNSDAALRMRVLRYADKADITTDGHIDWNKVDAYVKRINDGEIKDPEPEFDVSDPTTILTYNQQNQVAGKLIGIFANQNTNHVYSSLLHQLELAQPILFGNHTLTGLKDMLHAPEGVDVDTNVAEYLAASVDAVKDPVLNYLNLNSVTADAGAMLARIGYSPMEIGLLFNQPIILELCNHIANNGVSSDVAIVEMARKLKCDDLKKFQYQANEVTTDKLANNIINQNDSDAFRNSQLHVLALFNEILADSSDVSSFVQCTRFTAANSIGSTQGDQIAQEERIKNFTDKYVKKKKENGDNQNQQSDEEETDPRKKQRLKVQLFDPNYVKNEGSVSPENANMSETNQGILNTSEQLLDISDDEYMARMSRNPLAFEQCMMDLTRKATRKIFGRHFPFYTTLYNNMRNVMGRFTKYGGLDADTINSLHREFIVYLLSRQRDSLFDGEGLNTSFGNNVTNREYYTGEVYDLKHVTESFPKLLSMLKNDGDLVGIPFFEAISMGSNENSANPVITIQGMGGLQTRSSNMLTEMWADAFSSDAVIKSSRLGIEIPVKKLAKDLFFYNYYKMGFNFHPTVFMNLVPTILKQGLTIDTFTEQKGYINFIRDVIGGKVGMDTSKMFLFAQQYMLNHLDNKKLVFYVKGQARTAVQNALGTNNKFTLSKNQLGGDLSSLFIINDKTLNKGEVAFRPIIAVEADGKPTRYFMSNSGTVRFNVTPAANGTMTYVEVFPQGTKGKNIQYFNDPTFANIQSGKALKTISQENVAKAERENPLIPTEAESPVENSFVEIESGDDISSMFSDAEWEKMAKMFLADNPGLTVVQEEIGNFLNTFKRGLMNTSNSDNLEILNKYAKKVKSGEEFEDGIGGILCS